MRIKLKGGKQKELILLAKKDLTWQQLAKKLNVGAAYLASELKNEKRTVSEENYEILCLLALTRFDNFIKQKLNDNWGRSRGGKMSNLVPSTLKSFTEPKMNKNLAEIFGIILGDGHIEERMIGKKVRNYCVRIAGNSSTDKDYIFRYIPKLFEKVFKERGKTYQRKNVNCAYFSLYGKNLIRFLKKGD